MKSVLFIAGLLISSLTYSYQKTGKGGKQTTSQPAVIEQNADKIIRDTVTGKDGVQLAMAFNNANQTATFVLKGETIDLKQDQMASGIRYSNANYEFTEHQRKMTLKKNGNVIFSR